VVAKHKGIDQDLIDLLLKLVKFNPNDRASIDECLKSPVFKDIRSPDNEIPSAEQINLTIDSIPYDNGEYRDYSIKKLKDYMLK